MRLPEAHGRVKEMMAEGHAARTLLAMREGRRRYIETTAEAINARAFREPIVPAPLGHYPQSESCVH